MSCWCSFTVLVFILNLPYNLIAKYADLKTVLTGSFLLSVFFIILMSFSHLGPQ